jgi:putative ABC transport system permease protein
MLKNYLKIAWRNLLRNKGFSITNLLGLSIGITSTLLILLWVRDELNFDKFHKNYNSIYQVIATRDFKNQVFTDRNMVLPFASEIEKKCSEVKNAVVTTYPHPRILEYGNTKIKKSGYTVSEHFFNVFTWKFVRGNMNSALADPSSIILTESAAKSFFGNNDPINKVLKVDNSRTAKVTAVLADPPHNSTFIFDYIEPFNYSDPDTKRSMSEWQNSSWNVFVNVNEGANMSDLQKTINKIKKEHDPHDEVSTYFTFPMYRWRLYSEFRDGKNTGGMIAYVRLFIIIAFGILLIACVNFMNLSTARSEKRAKEVGIRKTLGSRKKQLVLQFYCESMILAMTAFVLSLVIVFLLMPYFNQLVNKQLTIFISSAGFWLLAVAIILFTGVVAGSYPALYLSSFNPIKVLKGTFLAGREAVLPRRVLVVVQFVISILLISGTIIIYQQIQHIKDRQMGYDPDNLIMVPSSPDIDKNYSVIKQELIKTGHIASVTGMSSPITEVWWKSPAPGWEGKPANAEIIFSGLAVGKDFTKTLGIRIVDGRDFSGTPADSSYMLLNKAAISAMNLKNPVGRQLQYGKTFTVLGIIDNMVMESPFKPVDPLMVFFDGEHPQMVSVRLNPTRDPSQALAAMEKVFRKYNPEVPFEYTFADQEYAKKFISEELINRITNIFAALAIFICCIGLAGLASFTIEKRTREIGIRKVLGASLRQLLTLISKEFVRLVLIAFAIAIPLTVWLMNNWLDNYTYHVQISMWLFATVGVLVLSLTLLVVGVNTISAATSNPVKSLRTE